MTELPLISIVTPSYNQAQFLEETIQSVLNQDYPRVEYIIIDGASTDGSVDIIRKYENEIDYWESKKDKGQTDAINKGFNRSRGDILAWLNSDDLYKPGAFNSVVEYFVAHPEVDMIYGNIDLIDEHSNIIRHSRRREYNFKDLLSNKLVVPQQAAFFRRRCFEAVGGLETDMFHAMDFDLWVKIGLRFTICHVKTVLAQFRYHMDAKSVAQAYTVGPELLKTLDWVFDLPDLSAEIRAARNEIYSGALIVAGTGYYASLRLPLARASYWQAIGLYPPQLWRSNVLPMLLRTLLGQRLLVWIRTWKQRKYWPNL